MTNSELKVLAAKVMSQHKTFKRGLSNQTVDEVVSALLLSASQADKIAELEEEQVDDYLEASTYAISLFNAHYKSKADAVPIELCDTTRGVVTQIDNMVTGVIAELEKELKEAKEICDSVSHVGVDFGHGVYTLEDSIIHRARLLLEGLKEGK